MFGTILIRIEIGFMKENVWNYLDQNRNNKEKEEKSESQED